MKPHVAYVSYDGAAEPLGLSQVVPYLERLTEAVEISLISFEKSGEDVGGLAQRLSDAGINWIPHRYHGSPPVASTWWDVRCGARELRRLHRSRAVDIVHARSYVPALMALRTGVLDQARFLFDIRGFWADERVEGGIWRRGALYALAKRSESRFFRRADAVVTLTDASVPWIRRRVSSEAVPIDVIPTCVDLDRYRLNEPRAEGPRTVWCGSLGTWYRFELATRLARALALPFTVLTRQAALARELLGDQPADVRSVASERVPSELRCGDIGLCLVKSSFSKQASAPTRFAEYLASGMPVAVTSGVGDLEQIVEGAGVGVVIRETDQSSLEQAAAELIALSHDPDVRERCRAVACERFALTRGAARYAALYRALSD